MARTPRAKTKPADTPVAAPHSPASPSPASPWTITLGGEEMALVPHLDALVEIETRTDKSLYRLVRDGVAEALSIGDMLIITHFLTKPPEPEPEPEEPYRLFASFDEAMDRFRRGPQKAEPSPLLPLFVEAGLTYCALQLLAPLSAVVNGEVLRDGTRKPATE